MKMTPEHYAGLRDAIRSTWDQAIARGWRPESYVPLSPTRLRWDLLHASKYPTRPLYDAGLKDSHIDTALRKIMAEIAP